MKRKHSIPLVIAAVVLLVSAAPVMASHAAVVSVVTTDSDFQNNNVADQFVVDGSGESADMVTETDHIQGAAHHWHLDGDFSDPISGATMSEKDGDVTFTSSSHGQAAVFDDDESAVAPPEYGPPFTASLIVNPDTVNNSNNRYLIQSGFDYTNAKGWQLKMEDGGSLSFFSGDSLKFTTSTGVISPNEKNHIILSVDSSGNLNLYVDGSLVHTTTVSIPSTADTGTQISGSDYDGTIDEVRFYTRALPSGQVDELFNDPEGKMASAVYFQDHAVDNPTETWSHLTVEDASVEVKFEVMDGVDSYDRKHLINSTRISASGTKTVNLSRQIPSEKRDWARRVRVVVEDLDVKQPDGGVRVHDHGVYAATSTPEVDDSSLSPNSTSSTIGDLPVTLEASISDADFATSQGDSLTVEWYVDGSKRGESSVSSNGTVSHTLDNIDSGTHDWHIRVTDEWGNTETSATASFAMPGELRIYNESAPNSLVDSATVNIQFYGGQDGDAFTVQRSTTDGTIDMSGLPADQEFIVVVNSDGYHNRRIYLESLTEQANVYLLPTSEQAVYNVFRIDDKSGSYPPGETRIIIQRALNKSGNFTWQTVSGDFFGSTNEHKTNLRYNVRYRLIVENDEGQRRMMGLYFATDENNPKVITISSIVVSPPEGQAYYGTSWIDDETEDDGQKTLRFAYTDPDEATDSLDVVIYERGNESNVLADISTDNVGDKWTYSTVLDENESAKSWVVDWQGQREGEEIGAAVPVGNRGGLPLPMSQEWLTRFGLIALVVVASLSSERMATIGAMGTVAFAGILMITGIWPIPVVLWFAALIIAVGGHALTKAQRGGVVG